MPNPRLICISFDESEGIDAWRPPGSNGPGVLGMLAVTVTSAVQAAGLLRGTHSRGLMRLTAPEVVVKADTARIPVGVDGEALLLDTPVRCAVQPAALWVRVPCRDRSGVPDPKPLMDWTQLWRMAHLARA